MNDEIPYSLYIKFLKPAEAVRLILTLEALELICLGEERIDENFSVVHYHFKNDDSKKLLFHVEIENNSTERINISIYSGVELNQIKNLFTFLKNFYPDNVLLIDQEIKNEFFIKSDASEKVSENWASEIEKKAILKVDFEEFYKNGFELKKRNKVLGK